MTSRTKACEKLLATAVNAAIEQRHMSLRCEPVPPTVFEFRLDDCSVVAQIHDVGYVGFVEVWLQAIFAPTEAGREFIKNRVSIRNEQRRYGTAIASGILERGRGKYLQGSGRNYYGAHAVNEYLAALDVEPLGFATRPPRWEVRR